MRRAGLGWVLGVGLAAACGSAVEEQRPAEVEVVATSSGELDVGTQRVVSNGRDVSTERKTPVERDVEPERAAIVEGDADSEARPSALELVFVGDVVLGEYVFDDHRSFAGPLAPGDPFADVAELLHADLVVGNLESPVMFEIPERSPLRGGHRFGASAPAVDGLAAGGFDVMSVANNHANDLAREGLEQTPLVLRERGILPVGSAVYEGSPLRVETLEHRGWRIGWLSATTWLNHAPAEGDPAVPVVRVSALRRELVPLVEQAQGEHDLMIVLLHWGRERRERPEPAQIHAAHALIDAGADLVIGHHPHVLQGIERYGDGLIAYSLGNFLFPAREEAFRDSAVLRVRVRVEERGSVVGAELRAVRLASYVPQLATSGERSVIHERLQRLGRAVHTQWRVQEGGAALRVESVADSMP